MTELLLLIPTLIVALLHWQQGRRHERTEKAWREERVTLLNRIQAPQVEVAKQFDVLPEPSYVGFDDDEGFWKYQKELTNGSD